MLEELKEDSNNWEKEVEETLKKLQEKETLLFLNQPHDNSNAVLSIKAGAGGKDAQDWAEMLLRMYLRYLEKEYDTEILDKTAGKEAGIKQVTVKVEGKYAYGYLRSEHGTHRLVRLSPFNTAHSRETSFAMVEVIPLTEDTGIEIKDKDLKIDTFRSSGPGGQSVNTTSSAVRITHTPTGITVSCQNERSQGQNKETAMKILKSRLLQKKEEEKEKKVSQLKGEQKDASWGNQIRSYVLHPYTMVKDHRTNYSVSNAEKVLDGEIGGFVKKYLRYIIRDR